MSPAKRAKIKRAVAQPASRGLDARRLTTRAPPESVEELSRAKLGRYLDPIIAVPTGEGVYWSPNGYHRLAAR